MIATTTEPALGAIRLAWWREQLEGIDRGQVPAEPRLVAVLDHLVKCGISGTELSKLEDAWLPLLQSFPWGEEAVEGLKLRGRLLFNLGARLLKSEAADAGAAGALWSLVDAANHCSDAESRQYLCAAARSLLEELPQRLPGTIRPLTVLAALAAYDLRPGGRLGRVGIALVHKLRGTFPR